MTPDETPTRIYLCHNRNGHPRFEEVGPDDIGAEAWVREGAGVWPDFIAPPKYDAPDPRWIDPKLPDFRLIWKVARECGYSIGLHGSMKRDCDLIAAPWTDEAVIAFDLIDRLCVELNAKQVGKIASKPHGRLGWSLQIDGWFKVIDISVMPRACDLMSGKVDVSYSMAKEIEQHVADEIKCWPEDTPYQNDLKAFAAELKSRLKDAPNDRT